MVTTGTANHLVSSTNFNNNDIYDKFIPVSDAENVISAESQLDQALHDVTNSFSHSLPNQELISSNNSNAFLTSVSGRNESYSSFVNSQGGLVHSNPADVLIQPRHIILSSNGCGGFTATEGSMSLDSELQLQCNGDQQAPSILLTEDLMEGFDKITPTKFITIDNINDNSLVCHVGSCGQNVTTKNNVMGDNNEDYSHNHLINNHFTNDLSGSVKLSQPKDNIRVAINSNVMENCPKNSNSKMLSNSENYIYGIDYDHLDDDPHPSAMIGHPKQSWNHHHHDDIGNLASHHIHHLPVDDDDDDDDTANDLSHHRYDSELNCNDDSITFPSTSPPRDFLPSSVVAVAEDLLEPSCSIKCEDASNTEDESFMEFQHPDSIVSFILFHNI